MPKTVTRYRLLSAAYGMKALAFLLRIKSNAAFKGWFDTFTENGETPAAGTVAKLPKQAGTLRLIAGSYGEAFTAAKLPIKLMNFRAAQAAISAKAI